jgi:transcriptional regulator GlxA family with amidase domain
MEIRRCGILLLPGYSMLAAAGVLEALQLAGEMQDEARYAALLLSESGGAVAAEGGAALLTEALLLDGLHALFVISGESSMPSLAVLEALRSAIVPLAGIDGGSAILAEAGVLIAGQRATVHWKLTDALIDEFPDVVWTGNVWEINANATRLSCGGGTSSVDLMLAWLSRLHGERLAQELALRLGLERLRGRDERQRAPISERRGGSPKLTEALALMEANLAEPLPTEEVARLVGVSRRQLERLFKQHLDALPSRYYLALRLNRAQRLLQQSSQSILQIGLSCGFSSGPHFSNAYKAHFNHTPRDERTQRAAAWREKPGETLPS